MEKTVIKVLLKSFFYVSWKCVNHVSKNINFFTAHTLWQGFFVGKIKNLITHYFIPVYMLLYSTSHLRLFIFKNFEHALKNMRTESNFHLEWKCLPLCAIYLLVNNSNILAPYAFHYFFFYHRLYYNSDRPFLFLLY